MGAVTASVAYKPDTTQSTTWTSTYNYTQIGGQARLDTVVISDGRPRTVTYRTDLSFQIIRRDEADNISTQGDPHEIWYRFGDVRSQRAWIDRTKSCRVAHSLSHENTAPHPKN